MTVTGIKNAWIEVNKIFPTDFEMENVIFNFNSRAVVCPAVILTKDFQI